MFAQDTITCSACSREWDGNAQCPCWLDDAYEVWESPRPYTHETDTHETEPYCILSKEQVRKGLFLQLGKKQGLPKELIISIYIALMKSENDDIDKVREYHTLNIDGNLGTIGPRIYPMNRGLEWLIKSTRKLFLPLNDIANICQRKSLIHKYIEIIGQTGYLNGITGKSEEINAEGIKIVTTLWGEANLQHKLLYLKTSPVDEIVTDYDDYILQLSLNMPSIRLYIDEFGEAMMAME